MPRDELKTATLEIPAEYVPHMRYAALKEIQDESKMLAKEAAQTVKALEEEEFLLRHDAAEKKDFSWRMSDLHGTWLHVQEALDVSRPLCEDEHCGEIKGTAAGLAYLLGAFVEHVAAERPGYSGPLEPDDDKNGLLTVIGALRWAGDEEARLRVIDAAERRAIRASKEQS